jgi:hypothetical protein
MARDRWVGNEAGYHPGKNHNCRKKQANPLINFHSTSCNGVKQNANINIRVTNDGPGNSGNHPVPASGAYFPQPLTLPVFMASFSMNPSHRQVHETGKSRKNSKAYCLRRASKWIVILSTIIWFSVLHFLFQSSIILQFGHFLVQ